MNRLRDSVAGLGYLAGSGTTKGFEFIISKSEIFYGVPLPLPPTQISILSPNFFPVQTFPGLMDDLILLLEDLHLVVILR
jgi:hypothetical protein